MKILQFINALTYGGVETYVARLSRALHEQGESVTVLSSEGGPLESLFTANEIEVIRAPFAQGVPAICQALEGRTFDLLNAHNYHAARYGHQVAARLGIPYVMTVHGPRPWWKRLFVNFWSPRIITMSPADRRDLCGPLGLPAARVEASFLPVDTERYHREPDARIAGDAWCPDPRRHLIVHISRVTNRKVQASLALLDALPLVCQQMPEARLLIVGAGPFSSEIGARAEALCRAHGPIVRVEEPRLDLSGLFHQAAVVVATATTAMEALACGTPVIAAGRTGHLGLMDRTTFAQGLDLLFADHGRAPYPITSTMLATDLLRVLYNPEQARVETIPLAETITSQFSPRLAAEDIRRIYQSVLQDPSRTPIPR